MSQLHRRFLITAHSHLADIRKFILSAADSLGADAEQTADMIVAVNEATTNSFIHGYKEKPCPLDIVVAYKSGVLTVEIIDQAPPFDPTKLERPNTNAPLDKRKPGGLGVHMIHEFTDQMTYKRTAQEQNHLVLQIGEFNHD